MSISDRERWERKHAEPARALPRASIDELLDAVGKPPRNAVALDLACGQGRNCKTLLDRGYRVVAADIARGALVRARSVRTSAGGDPVRTAPMPVQIDTDEWPFRPAAFELILQCDFLDRHLFSNLRRSVKPRGVLIIETFVDVAGSQDAGPRNPAFRLRPGELTRALRDWEIVRVEQIGTDGTRASIVARHPPIDRH